MSADQKIVSEDQKQAAERKKRIEEIIKRILPDTFLGPVSLEDLMRNCLLGKEYEKSLVLTKGVPRFSGTRVEQMREENFQLFSGYFRNNPEVTMLYYRLDASPNFDPKYQKWGLTGTYFESPLPNATRFHDLASLYSSLPNLTHLSFDNNCLDCHKKCRTYFSGPCYVSILLNNIRCNNLTSFRITMDSILISKEKHMNALSSFIKAHKNLQELHLHPGPLNPAHFKLLEQAIQSNPSITFVRWVQYNDRREKNTTTYAKRLQEIVRNNVEIRKLNERLSFVSGMHARLGADSSVCRMKQNPLYSKDAVRIIFQFAGCAIKSAVDLETEKNEELLRAYNDAHNLDL